MWITVGCLFIGRAVTPLASESLDASTTALIEDTTLNITAADLASLSSAGAVCGALGKILAGPTIGIVNGRNAWLMLLLVGTVSMLCIANVTSVGELFMVWMAYTPFAAMAFPATTVIVAGWVRLALPSPPPPPHPPHPVLPPRSRARTHAHEHALPPKPHPSSPQTSPASGGRPSARARARCAHFCGQGGAQPGRRDCDGRAR